MALGDRPGEATIVKGGSDDQNRLSFSDIGGERVAVDTVDRVCSNLGLTHIDLLKIDTEGKDLDVLRGAAQLLHAQAISIVEVESAMNRDNRLHVRVQEFLEFLEPRAYRLFGVYEQVLEWPNADAYLRRSNLVFVSGTVITANRQK
jgi:hypothetical protein